MSKSTQRFFAASNGFDGFISYFNEVFDPYDFERIFILKGGPGTGKSSFLKSIVKKFEYDDYTSFELIHCSSDPKSLDGVIITKKEKKIAIIDGTAPHVSDPIIPGAVEKIINIGECWNESLLKNNAEIIKKHTDCKRNSYKNAFEYLSVASVCDDVVCRTLKKCFEPKLDTSLSGIFEKRTHEKSSVKIRLLKSFGRQGFFEFDPNFYDIKKAIQIVGIYGSDYLVMNEIFDLASRSGSDMTISHSPIDKNKIDSIYLEKEKIYIYIGKKVYIDNTETVDASKYIDISKLDDNRSKIETLYKEREAMLWCAMDEFTKASSAHETLEKIYTASMNFKKSDKLLKKVCDEIQDMLFTEDLNAQIP